MDKAIVKIKNVSLFWISITCHIKLNSGNTLEISPHSLQVEAYVQAVLRIPSVVWATGQEAI